MKVNVRYWTEFGGSDTTMDVEEIATFAGKFTIMSVTPCEEPFKDKFKSFDATNETFAENDEPYQIIINDVAKFRVELMTMIEKVKFNIDGYANSSSSEIAESFEHKINSF